MASDNEEVKKIDDDTEEKKDGWGEDGAGKPGPPCSGPSLKRKREDSEPVPIAKVEDDSALPNWVAGASPARFVTLDELIDMSSAMENMALVHEIAINPDFSIPESSVNPLENAVKDCLHKLYWQKMREDIAKDPPDYTHAFSTLMDIKSMVLELLTPQHVRLKMEIDSRLDEVILKQQYEKKCLDWPRISEYIIELLARLCAPVRDRMVAELRGKTDLVDILRGICELLELMKIDMANFEVKLSRPLIEEHSATYEKNQFLKLLESDPDLETSVSEWLKKHLDAADTLRSNVEVTGPAVKRRFEDLNNTEIGAIISNAYLDLLEWDPENGYPSTLLIDRVRFEELAKKYLQLIVCTSCVLITCVSAGENAIDTSKFKEELKNELLIIMEDVDRSNLHDRLEAVYVQCDANLRKLSEKTSFIWNKEKTNDLKLQIMAVSNEQNPVRSLMRQRIRAFLLSVLKCEAPSYQQKLPAGVTMVKDELSTLTAAFVRLATHNRKSFGTYYGDLIKKLMSV